ncbi:MAG: SIR2 family protein [Ignavibacteriales bacterium]|nr:SIR2 family protein [Ignavibacteriales bacterium]
MRLIEKRDRKKRRELKRRRKNLFRQSKCSYCKSSLIQRSKHITYSKGNLKKNRGGSKQNKIAVILLGAGAGRDWNGPLTSDIDRSIREDIAFKTVSEQTPIGEFVFSKLEEYYGVSGSVNFETFLGVLELLVDYVLSKTNEGGTSPANTSFIPLLNSLESWIDEIKDYRFEIITSPEDLVQLHIPRTNEYFENVEQSIVDRIYFSELLKHYYSLVATKIEEYVVSICNEDNLSINNSLKRFIQFLQSSGYTIRAYTTNYDRLFPHVLRDKIKIFDGFNTKDSSELNSSDDYQIDKILNDKACNTYYNLHGCLNWQRSFVISQLGYKFSCTPNQTHTTIEFRSMLSANPGHTILPINIVTGYNKVQRLSLEPLNLFFNSFTSDCNNADYIITIGYSFGDFHINRALSLGIQKERTKHLHISFNNSPNDFVNTPEFNAITTMQSLTSGTLRIIPNDEKWLKSNDKEQRKKVYLHGLKGYLTNEEWIAK